MMMNKVITGIAILLAFLIFSTTAYSQQLTPTEDSALVNVHVSNFNGEPHKGINILFSGGKNEATFSGVSNEEGRFSILLPEGDTYQIKYEVFDKTFNYQNIQIPARRGQMTTEIKIQVEPPRSFTLDDVHFETGKATLQKSSYKHLDELVKIMKEKESMRIEVAGHTDNVGGKEENRKLSQRRAQTLKDYFVEKGVSPGRIEAKGYGASQPIATNETEAGRQKNRRTEVKILER